ncbi:hypothetical protein KUV50_07455 [Membranicola marinus]|uniref:Outer membrane protein beta-barrel domain-containing protein n=1 Tax=Membranihabitans marinus TaxID=1227546 RepID=A0A953LCM9_9BACT|nr:hypothetical protein [Membranihabitans marinus]MBY5957959.1 hypothetical protein [Membranihabitans marinus]
MKALLLTLILSALTILTYAQDVGVVPSTFGIQAGPIGIWAHNETRLSPSIALRSEVGFSSSISSSDYFDNTGIQMFPELTLEPRWYYNLQKRAQKGKSIDGNSGDFFSLKMSYHPDWFTISNYEDKGVMSDLSIMPTWGIRRHLGKHFTYEAGIGAGYRYQFAKQAGFAKNNGEFALNLHLRIGYRF